ncbi:MAG: RNA methyltransferase [Deltaproteobacteria bacterium]|nr:RNA methyltransferase [Deltaproteobacteria bacterium]
MDLTRVTVVLDKVRHPDNLGSTLRAMKNCGLTRLVLSDPRTRDFERAKVMGLDGSELLERMVVVPTLSEAVAHGTLVAGTTSRRPQDRPTQWLREFVEEASRESDAAGEVVLVFGNEQRGLSDEELDACHVVVNIPAAPAKESINLAQAVMLVAHECYVASMSAGAPPPRQPPPEPAARAGTLQALHERMRQVLLEADFLNRQNPEAILTEVRRTLERARLSQREAELWLTAFKHLLRAMGREPGARGS